MTIKWFYRFFFIPIIIDYQRENSITDLLQSFFIYYSIPCSVKIKIKSNSENTKNRPLRGVAMKGTIPKILNKIEIIFNQKVYVYLATLMRDLSVWQNDKD